MKSHKKDWANEIVFILSRPYVFAIILAFLFIPAAKISQALESGAEFLKIDTDARAVSMGSAYTAAADGVNAIAYNPAGLASLKGVEFGFSHTNWLLDSKHDFLGLGMPLKNGGGLLPSGNWVMGLGVTRLTSGSLESRGADRSASGSFSAYDQSISLAMAGVMGGTRVGLAAKYIEGSIAGEKARAAAVDVGAARGLGNLPVSLGLSVQNLGTPMQYISQKDPLPLTFATGLLFSVAPGFSMALDVKRLVYDKQTGVSIGTEYSFIPGFALRTGYMMNNAALDTKNKGFSVGAGVNLLNTQLDYSVTPFGILGDAQRISLKKKF